MHVLISAEVPADQDQVQRPVVDHLEVGERTTCRVGDPEDQLTRLAGAQLRLVHGQGPAVPGDLQPAGPMISVGQGPGRRRPGRPGSTAGPAREEADRQGQAQHQDGGGVPADPAPGASPGPGRPGWGAPSTISARVADR